MTRRPTQHRTPSFSPWATCIAAEDEGVSASSTSPWPWSEASDSETALQHLMHTRTYVPMLGRFTSPDPVSEFHLFNPQTANRYIYALDSPARYTDPYGLRAEDEGEGSEGEGNDPCSDPTSDSCQIAIAAAQTANETVTPEPISPGLAAVIRGTQLAAPVVETTGALTLTFLTSATLGLAPSSYAGPLSFGLDIFNMQIGSRTLPFMPHAIKRMFQRGLGVDKVRDTVAASKPFQYFHKGVWKTGYYDPASQVFVGEDGIVLTVMTKVKPGYIERLKAATP